MGKRKYIRILCLSNIIITMVFLSGCISNIENEKCKCVEIAINDKSLLNAFDYYIDVNKIDTSLKFLWVFIGNEPAKKSFSITDCYYLEDSILRKNSFFSKYRGLNIVINTGYDNFNQQNKDYPDRFIKFTNKKYFIGENSFYTYEYDLKTGKDTIYHTLKFYYWVSEPKTKFIYRGNHDPLDIMH